jgi:hypothetical protein
VQSCSSVALTISLLWILTNSSVIVKKKKKKKSFVSGLGRIQAYSIFPLTCYLLGESTHCSWVTREKFSYLLQDWRLSCWSPLWGVLAGISNSQGGNPSKVKKAIWFNMTQ